MSRQQPPPEHQQVMRRWWWTLGRIRQNYAPLNVNGSLSRTASSTFSGHLKHLRKVQVSPQILRNQEHPNAMTINSTKQDHKDCPAKSGSFSCCIPDTVKIRSKESLRIPTTQMTVVSPCFKQEEDSGVSQRRAAAQLLWKTRLWWTLRASCVSLQLELAGS